MIKPKTRNQDGKLLSKSGMQDLVLIYTTYENKKIAAIINNGSMIQIFTEGKGLRRGSICIGKVSEIKEEINSAFLQIADKQKCFVHLDELKEEFNLTRPGKSIKCGDSFLIKIIKEPAKNKLATGSTSLSEEEEQYRVIAQSRTDYSVLKYGNSYLEEAFSAFLSLTDPDNTTTGRARIITDDSKVYSIIKEYTVPEGCEIQFYEDSLVSLSVLFGLTGKISEALSRRVRLKSGAELTFDSTEAFLSIDVNSGKSSGKNKLPKEQYLSLNLEAASEICRQVKLRNLSGIILIDFINMSDSEQNRILIDYMKENVEKSDPLFHIIDITKLGIMETTRQKTGMSLFEQFNS